MANTGVCGAWSARRSPSTSVELLNLFSENDVHTNSWKQECQTRVQICDGMEFCFGREGPLNLSLLVSNYMYPLELGQRFALSKFGSDHPGFTLL